jgi:hypothetical protein
LQIRGLWAIVSIRGRWVGCLVCFLHRNLDYA